MTQIDTAPASLLPDGHEELERIITAYSEVTERLRDAHDQLQREVRRLRGEIEEKNRELARRERLAALGEMAAGLAHEIRNPLGGIQLYASMLGRDLHRLDDRRLGPARDAARKISRGVESVDAIVRDVLAFARNDEPQRSWMRLGQCVDVAIEMLRAKLDGDGLRVIIDDGLDAIELFADPMQLQRVLVNLLSNAADACESSGRIEIHARLIGRGRRTVEIVVADDGPGIAPEVLERVFNPFFTTRAAGTGLGLAIVHRIVESHGGGITAGNRPGGGAEFHIRLPVGQRPAARVRQAG